MRFTRHLLGRKNQKGVALIMAIFCLTLIVYLVTETLYETNVEYIVNSNSVNRVKAYYAAKSGLELSLLRIKLYNKIKNQLGDKLPPDRVATLDLIWSFPFAWPPVLPAETNSVDKDLVKDTVKDSKMDATYLTTISDEGSKIDVNDLGSPSKGLRELTKKLLLQIFQNRMQNDDNWAENNRELKFEEVINNMADWVDKDTTSQNRGDEKQYYQNLNSLSGQDIELPPNRGFRTVDEIRLVAGMTETMYDMLKDRVTVYGMKAINPNHASAEVLKAMDPSINDKVISAVMGRRNDPQQKPFQSEGEFWGFINSEGGNVTEETQKSYVLSFSDVVSFHIKSIGEFSNVSREIEAIVYDFSGAAIAVADQLKKEAAEAAGGSAPGGPGSGSGKSNIPKDPLPKGPPRIVYFIER